MNLTMPVAKPCYACRESRPLDLFPLGRPRADGTRHPMRFCVDCIGERQGVAPEVSRELQRIARRESRFRRRQQLGHW